MGFARALFQPHAHPSGRAGHLEFQSRSHTSMQDLKAAEAKLGIDLSEMSVNKLLHRFGLHDHPDVMNIR